MFASLNTLLADYQVLAQKLRAYHWSVKGPLFFELHAKFETLYEDAAEKVDALAERIRALGGEPVSTLAGALAIARVEEDEDEPSAQEMLARLIDDYATLDTHLRDAAKRAESQDDRGTVNLLDGMADGQEKTVWMLRASLG